jgi:hypothetical protein
MIARRLNWKIRGGALRFARARKMKENFELFFTPRVCNFTAKTFAALFVYMYRV